MSMFIYNTTIKIDKEAVYEWLDWQKEIYIPQIIDTGLFYDYRIFELLDQEETDGKTFVIQYLTGNRSDYDKYIELYAAAFYYKAVEKWGNQFIEFQTLLKAVH